MESSPSIWIIDPHEPLIFRDGKPFDPAPGVRAQSLLFPFPSTIAGGIRTLAGLDEQGRFTISGQKALDTLKQLKVRGPILVELAPNGRDITDWLVPAPQDALIRSKPVEGDESRYPIAQLVPLTRDEKVKTDLDLQSPLLFVGQNPYKKEKPNKKAPRYWYWRHLEKWLSHPEAYEKKPPVLVELGHNGPSEQVRVHVAIDPNTRAGKDQYLFDTVGMEFTTMIKEARPPESEEVEPRLHLQQACQLGLAVIVDDHPDHKLSVEQHQRLSPLGGEKRLASWRKSVASIPKCPEDIKKAIIEQGSCRVVLLTPAFFDKGYYPTTCLESPHAQVELRAIKIDRSQVVSGFDIDKGEPRGTRRLAPAGTVLFLKFVEDDKNDIASWIDATWMHCLTEGKKAEQTGAKPQEYYDGFGLAVLGTWSHRQSEQAAE